MNVVWAEDSRDGYEHHATVNITWEPPCNYELISHYTLIIFSQGLDCGRGHTDTETYDSIPRDADIFSVSARANGRLPKVDCRYQYTVRA